MLRVLVAALTLALALESVLGANHRSHVVKRDVPREQSDTSSSEESVEDSNENSNESTDDTRSVDTGHRPGITRVAQNRLGNTALNPAKKGSQWVELIPKIHEPNEQENRNVEERERLSKNKKYRTGHNVPRKGGPKPTWKGPWISVTPSRLTSRTARNSP